MFKGAIARGSSVSAKFSSNFTNTGQTHLVGAFASVDGNGVQDSATASPGGAVHITLQADGNGTLRIVVDMAVEADSGLLEVAANDEPLPNSSEAIQGDTTWTYTVIG